MPGSPERPAVSIILPTYNRAKFLPQAFAAIRSQTFTDWELIVVDDGSTDDTGDLVGELTRGWPQPVRYHRQENQGAYGARNTGLNLAAGAYVAFYDSDDVWLPHHLQDCVAALEAAPDVDWVYGACRLVEFASGREVAPSTFRVGGRPRPFRCLRARPAGRLRVIEDGRAIECAILQGLYAGLQNSVLRRRVFESYRFEATRRNEAEDQLLVIQALAAGRRLGYLDNVHVVYHLHDDNSSATGTVRAPERHLRVFRALVAGYEDLRAELHLTPSQRRALDRRLGQEYFWHLGYVLLGQGDADAEALALMRRGLRAWPWSLACWKTYLLAWLRVRWDRRRSPAPVSCTERGVT
jgi:glycosyltransferase involved in cell wall biosynthesis